MGHYRLSKPADIDVRNIFEYGVRNFGLTVADKYFDGLFDQFQKIADTPKLYQSVDHIRKGYRRSVFQAHSIYYVINKTEGVEIVRVLGRQDVKAAF